MLRKVGEFECDQSPFDGGDRVIESRFVDQNRVRAVSRNAQDADVGFGQRTADLRDETDYRKVEHRVETDQAPSPLRHRVRKPRLQFAPDVFVYNQCDLFLVARQRDKILGLEQTGGRLPVKFERKAYHGKSRFRQVETNWHKITQSLRKPEPGTSPRRETSRGRSE